MGARIGRLCLSIWLILGLAFVVAPLVIVVIISLSKTAFISLPKHGWTLHWWKVAITSHEFHRAALLSLEIALFSVVLALAIGVPAAFGLSRSRQAFGPIVRILLSGPIIVPEIMTALAILSLVSHYGIGGGYAPLYIAHVLITLPYAVQLLAAAFTRTDIRQEWAAKSLGASAVGTFIKIVIPQVSSELMAAALFIFIVSWNNAGLSIFLSGSQASTLPADIFVDLQYSASPSVIAACAELILLSVVVATLLKKFFSFDTVLTRQMGR